MLFKRRSGYWPLRKLFVETPTVASNEDLRTSVSPVELEKVSVVQEAMYLDIEQLSGCIYEAILNPTEFQEHEDQL